MEWVKMLRLGFVQVAMRVGTAASVYLSSQGVPDSDAGKLTMAFAIIAGVVFDATMVWLFKKE